MSNVDKNIVALLREDAFTVQVHFGLGEYEIGDSRLVDFMRVTHGKGASNTKAYTYLCTFPVKAGDIVVVPSNGEIQLAKVIAVDVEVNIPSDDSIRYKWVIDVINMYRYTQLMQENVRLENAVREAYQRSIKVGLKERLLASMNETDRAAISSLLQPSATLTKQSVADDDSEGGAVG